MTLRLLPVAAIALLALSACGGESSDPETVTQTQVVPESEMGEQEPGAEERVADEEAAAPKPANPVTIAKKVTAADCEDATSGSSDIDGNRYVSCILNDQEMSVTTYVGDPQQLGAVEPSDDTTSTIYGDDFVLYMWNGDVTAETVAKQVGGKVEPALP